jgi:clan AA aspartic protease
MKKHVQNEFYQDVVVANPKNLKHQIKLHFLVDTGSSGTVIPSDVAEQLELDCCGEGWVEVADGRRLKIKLAYLYMRINSEHVFTLCSYDGCPQPLLGFDIMHVLGLQIDAGKKQLLKPIRRFSLKSFVLTNRWIVNRNRRKPRDG